MTLPQNILDNINKTATEASKGIGDVNRSYAYYHGRVDGAIEWTGKASGLVSTLELLRIWLNECNEHGKLLDADKAAVAIDAALAKYKEVSNG